ncbi:MAG: ribonuclease R [Xanthomonadales bacterium]|nr:ribonuclease R [Xanthomonadales bacterium]
MSGEAPQLPPQVPGRAAILAFLDRAARPLKLEELAAGLGVAAPAAREILGRRLEAMVRDGQLHRNRRGGYAPTRKLDILTGVVLGHPDGFAFVRPDRGGDDVFLPPSQARLVMHGDRVAVCIAGVDPRGRPEGMVTEVLERRPPRLLGRYEERRGVGVVVPDDRRLPGEVLIPPDASRGARPGELVVCLIREPPTPWVPAIGEVQAVLGPRLTPSLAVEAAIHNHGLRHEWPPEVLAELAAVPHEVGEEDRAGREDLRGLDLVTIDGEDAKDFDDAILVTRRRDGGFRLLVAIADVSRYVRPGSAIDEEARRRGTSVYFPGFVVPMLPEPLSNGICSLNPEVDRLCFACEIAFDAEGAARRSRFFRGVMRSRARLSYTQVWAAIGQGEPGARRALGPALLARLEDAFALYRLLAERRHARGALDFESREMRFRLDPGGRVEALGWEERNDAHRLIEECMIAANVEAARFLARRRVPAPYRVHDRPPAAKYEALLEFLREFHLRLPARERLEPAQLARLLERARRMPPLEARLIETVVLRAQALAVYQTENIGHFGLALPAYAHFTSPIRRYPDLMLHRQLAFALAGAKGEPPHPEEALARLAAHCSRQERIAEEAEREVDERYRVAWLSERVGEVFAGVVSGVASFGLFVELADTGVSGLVHVTQLPADFYRFDPVRHTLTGARSGRVFRLGEEVTVQVLRASLEERKIDLRLVEERPARRRTERKAARR